MEYYTVLVYLLGDIVEAAGGNYTKMSVKEKCHVLAGFSNRSVVDLGFIQFSNFIISLKHDEKK